MRLKLIGCKAMARELSYLSALSQNNIDTTFIRQGYHNVPDLLRDTIQAEIDAVESGKDAHTNPPAGQARDIFDGAMDDFDAILIGYGLCSNGVVGLHSQKYPLVIPRGHDCITFFLGSRSRYQKYFKEMPGCFWYTGSWIENSCVPCERTRKMQEDYYIGEGYEQDDIDYLMETMNRWTDSYHYAAYIKMPFFDRPELREFTAQAAEFYHWQYREIEGDMSLLQKFIEGDWNSKDFLVVPPGWIVRASGDTSVITCEEL